MDIDGIHGTPFFSHHGSYGLVVSPGSHFSFSKCSKIWNQQAIAFPNSIYNMSYGYISYILYVCMYIIYIIIYLTMNAHRKRGTSIKIPWVLSYDHENSHRLGVIGVYTVPGFPYWLGPGCWDVRTMPKMMQGITVPPCSNLWCDFGRIIQPRSMGIAGSNWWRYVSTICLAIWIVGIFPEI